VINITAQQQQISEENIAQKMAKTNLRTQKEILPLEIVSAYDLQRKEIEPVQFIVDELLPYGLSIIASPPKQGKSFFALDLCIAVAEGKNFLGKKTNQCEVMYFALEDSLNRLNERTSRIMNGKDYPKGLYFSIECSTLNNGLEEQMDILIKEHPGIKLVVFDTLQYIRSGSKSRNENAYQSDYNEMKVLKSLAAKHNICILLIHHSRKESNPNDPFANISGTYGINGAMDCMITIVKENRADKQAKMSICGRDVEYGEYMIEFDSEHGKWKLTGTVEDYQEQLAKEQYNQNPIVNTIKKLVSTNSGRWMGKISDIISYSKYYGISISDSPKKIGKDIHKVNQLLYQYDGIACAVKTNGNATKTYEYKLDIPFKT
jgi:RecA-family ATPase